MRSPELGTNSLIEAVRSRIGSYPILPVEEVRILQEQLALARIERTRLEKRREIAREIAAREIKAGRMIRPSSCSDCSKEGDIEFHHAFGYEIGNESRGVWLCKKCHGRQPEVDKFMESTHLEKLLSFQFSFEKRWIITKGGDIEKVWGVVNGLGEFLTDANNGRLMHYQSFSLEADALKASILKLLDNLNQRRRMVVEAEKEMLAAESRLTYLKGNPSIYDDNRKDVAGDMSRQLAAKIADALRGTT